MNHMWASSHDAVRCPNDFRYQSTGTAGAAGIRSNGRGPGTTSRRWVMYPRQAFLRVSIFLGALLVALVFPGRATSAAPDLCIGGDTHGVWALPPGSGQTGQASGVLVVQQSDEPLFSLEATLTEGPPPMEFRLGEVDGILADSSGTPAYGIAGAWRTDPRDDTHGEWQATIYRLDTGETVGMIEAEFTREPGEEGTYVGQWVICEHP
jgi:hypothetical protein